MTLHGAIAFIAEILMIGNEMTNKQNRNFTENLAGHAKMKRICAWCNKILEEGEEPATHGICDRCTVKVLKRYKKHQTNELAKTAKI